MKNEKLNSKGESQIKKDLPFFLSPKLLVMMVIMVIWSGCERSEQPVTSEVPGAKQGKAKVLAAQPLPRGKRNFSVTMGNFDQVGRTWVRIINWTFNETNGTVAGTSWTWFSDVKTGYAPFNGGSHTCTMSGATATCTSDAPSGWNTSGASIHQSWSGTYTYNTTTNVLDIDWSTIAGAATNATDSWNVTLPETGLARVNLISSNYTLTHGRGYGSNAAWTTYKTISQIVAAGLPVYTGSEGKNIRAYSTTGNSTTPQLFPNTGPGQWSNAAFDLSSSTTPSSPTPAKTLHKKTGTTLCDELISDGGTCYANRVGTVYHFTVSGTNRQVGYSFFCACLPQGEWPCYSGNKHPCGFMQVIDDSGVLKGFVGIEAQNKSGYGFQFQCMDFTNIP